MRQTEIESELGEDEAEAPSGASAVKSRARRDPTGRQRIFGSMSAPEKVILGRIILFASSDLAFLFSRIGIKFTMAWNLHRTPIRIWISVTKTVRIHPTT